MSTARLKSSQASNSELKMKPEVQHYRDQKDQTAAPSQRPPRTSRTWASSITKSQSPIPTDNVALSCRHLTWSQELEEISKRQGQLYVRGHNTTGMSRAGTKGRQHRGWTKKMTLLRHLRTPVPCWQHQQRWYHTWCVLEASSTTTGQAD